MSNFIKKTISCMSFCSLFGTMKTFTVTILNNCHGLKICVRSIFLTNKKV